MDFLLSESELLIFGVPSPLQSSGIETPRDLVSTTRSAKACMDFF